MASIQLGESLIQRDGSVVYIVAEIGQNHQGSIEVAKNMIIAAKESGCNCVKFQKSCLPEKFTESALRREYHGQNSWGKTYGEHKAFLEFTMDQYRELQEFCKKHKIDFTASAMDEISLGLLDSMDVPFIKIGSGDANNFPLLEKAAVLKKPLVISTGMQTTKTIGRIVEIMKNANKSNYALMHCVSSYPTEPQDCQLHWISWLRERYPHIVIGYSGHEMGLEISKAAVLLGARVIERHFTLDRNQKGSDHKCSLEPADMTELVVGVENLMSYCNPYRALKDTEIINLLDKSPNVCKALQKRGEEKRISPCELICRNKLGKSLVAAKPLKSGHIIGAADICVKVSEPNGISGEYVSDVVGLKLLNNVDVDMPLLWQYVNIDREEN